MKITTLRLHARDTLVVALRTLEKGEEVEGAVCQEAIPRGHKVATEPISVGETVTKFGQGIGVATADIEPGEWIHQHNLGMPSGNSVMPDSKILGGLASSNSVPIGEESKLEFRGFRRSAGGVGTRNMLGILTTVNCSATVAKLIGREVEKRGLLRKFPRLDGLAVMTHSSGCGLVPSGDALGNLQRTLGGYARHANFGGVLVLGLGCETNDLATLFEVEGLNESKCLRRFAIQEVAGTGAAVERGVAEVMAMAAVANQDQRTVVSASHLCLGLQCGGSDGFSALTANPALGIVSDRLVAAGASVILAETPEVYGAEHLLLERAVDPTVGEALMERLAWWRRHAEASGGELDNNPSPGNKEGGLTTILEKSLGAVAKAGSSPLCGVLRYAETVPTEGLWFMDSPGFDPCSATGEIASGANLLCFTTGRGSVSGFLPTPSIKLATNSELARRMPDDIDLDCGSVLSGLSVEESGGQILDLLLRVASGETTRSEAWGFGEAEFVPWVPGAVF